MPSTKQTFRKSGGRGRGNGNARKARSTRPSAGRQAQRQQQASVNPQNMEELLLQALETELGGIEVYQMAIRCAQNDELREEWEKYLEETRNHERILSDVFAELGLDMQKETTGRRVVRGIGEALVQAMELALEGGEPENAQVVAAECVVLAETKDHLNWELIGELAKAVPADQAKPLQDAHDEVEDQEDEHLYHTKGWTRELWLQGLGIPAVLPPPEEKRDVKSAIGAARAQAGRKKLLRKA